jgi:hypothetical protein
MATNVYNKQRILDAINHHNMIFISAQPDTIYFHWQVSLYLYQFAKHGIGNRCYALFGYTGDQPSAYVQQLSKKYPSTVKYYKDTRAKEELTYSPSIRPHILAKFFAEYPQLGENVFYHDSDIFLVRLPRFDLMLNDNVCYLSDTVSYIGYNYIKGCSERYKEIHQSLPTLDIFYGMCEVTDMNPEVIKKNEANSGGAQYLLKNIDARFWTECQKKCYKLYSYLCEYEKKYPVSHHIQKWTTDMWIVLWECWRNNKITRLHKELDFSWATGSVDDYYRLNIFHLAGITGNNSSDKFHKGKYTSQTVFDAYLSNPSIFDHINKNNATYEYVKVILEYIENVYIIEKGLNKTNMFSRALEVNSFKMLTNNSYAGIYNKDKQTMCCNRPVWRSENGHFVVFWNTSSWVLTYSKYIGSVGKNSGGLISNSAELPYDNMWNGDIDIVV